MRSEMELGTRIRNEVIRQRRLGKKTSRGEEMSLAAIGRTLRPPVTRPAVYRTIDGILASERIRRAIEHELGKAYWMRKEATA